MSATDRLAEIQARANAATDGPWETGWDHQQFYVAPVSARGDEYERIMAMTFIINPGNSQDQSECATEDAVFIAHARTDVPRLVGALQAVLDVCDGLEEAHRANPKQTYEYGLEEAAHQVRNAIEAALGEVS